MKNKYLPLYNEWASCGELPRRNGLCTEFQDDIGMWQYEDNPLFLLLIPDDDQKRGAYWAREAGLQP